jgi:hypothetical protein
MSKATDDTTHIRVKKATLARLRQLAEGIAARVESNHPHPLPVDAEPINPAGCGVSMDALLNFLLDRLDDQRSGRKARKERAKQARQADQADDQQQ